MPKRILVIDDEEVILEVIQGCLEELAQWDILTAESGIEGLEMARSQRPDAILLDVSMPGMTGFEVLQQLQENLSTQEIPVILLTARVQPEDKARFSQLGMAGLILKPFDPMELAEQVAAVLGWEL